MLMKLTAGGTKENLAEISSSNRKIYSGNQEKDIGNKYQWAKVRNIQFLVRFFPSYFEFGNINFPLNTKSFGHISKIISSVK